MSESWRKYGGLNRPDAQNRFTVGTIVADEVLLREQVAGEFRIQGTATIEQELYALSDFIVDRNSLFKNDISVNNFAQVNKLALGNSVVNYFTGNETGLAVNHNDAISTVDIKGFDASQNWILRAKSTGPEVYNILAETQQNTGVIAGSNPSETYIQFFSDLNPVTYDRTSVAKVGYTVQQDGSTQFNIVSDSLVFADALQQVFLFDAYERPDVFSGISLQLKSNYDVGKPVSKSNTFARITGRDGEGLALGGGLYPLDETKEYSFIGIVDTSDNLFPSIVTERSDKIENRRIHMGFNTYDPRKEDYLLDINGKVIISYGEVTRTYGDYIQPYRKILGDSTTHVGRIAMIGSSIDVSQPHNYAIYYSIDGAKNWIKTELNEPEGLSLVPTYMSTSNFNKRPGLYNGREKGLQVLTGANNSFFLANEYCGSGDESAYFQYGRQWPGKDGRFTPFTFTNTIEGDTIDGQNNYFKTGADFTHIEIIFARHNQTGTGEVDANFYDSFSLDRFATILVEEQRLGVGGTAVLNGVRQTIMYQVPIGRSFFNDLNIPNEDLRDAFFNLGIPNNIFLRRDTTVPISGLGPYINTSNIQEITTFPDNLEQTFVTYLKEDQSIWCVGLGLVKINNDTGFTRYNFNTRIGGAADIWMETKQFYRMNRCEQDHNFLIAVGENIITVSKDGGANWNNRDLVNFPIDGISASFDDPLNLYGVHILDISNAIVCGDRGSFVYTIDGALTWTKVPNFVLDGSGTGERIYGSSSKLIDVYIQSLEEMVITKEMLVYQEADLSANPQVPGQQGLFYVYYLSIPALFNYQNLDVLDICGNTTISGNLTVERGSVQTFNSNLDLFNERVQVMNFGRDLQVMNLGKISDDVDVASEEYQEVGRKATRFNYKGDFMISERLSLGKGVDNPLDISAGEVSGLGSIEESYTADVSGNIYQRGFVHQF